MIISTNTTNGENLICKELWYLIPVTLLTVNEGFIGEHYFHDIKTDLFFNLHKIDLFSSYGIGKDQL